ncbi:MAG: S49 family peptidase, partial [Planctomycetota bacterium]
FKKRVVDGRKSKLTKPIDEVAGGRVFSGGQALELGLVDQIGGLDDAIKYAAGKAGQPDYDIRVIPEPPTIFELLMKQVHPDEYSRLEARSMAKGGDLSGIASVLFELSALDPARVRTVLQAIRGLGILQQERAAVWMAHPSVGP